MCAASPASSTRSIRKRCASRALLNVPFEGKTAPNQWIVVDIANDPLSTPHIYLCCDPVRPYVSAALPHAVRRFEFMVMPGETEEQLREPQNMRKLLSKVLPNPDNVELIRQRVYTRVRRTKLAPPSQATSHWALTISRCPSAVFRCKVTSSSC